MTIAQLTSPPSVVVFSSEGSTLRMMSEALDGDWQVIGCADPANARDYLIRPGTCMVLVDDSNIGAVTAGRLLDQIHQWSPRSLVAYIATNHSAEVERHVRSHNVQYYFTKPIDSEHMTRVLRSFANSARRLVEF